MNYKIIVLALLAALSAFVPVKADEPLSTSTTKEMVTPSEMITFTGKDFVVNRLATNLVSLINTTNGAKNLVDEDFDNSFEMSRLLSATLGCFLSIDSVM